MAGSSVARFSCFSITASEREEQTPVATSEDEHAVSAVLDGPRTRWILLDAPSKFLEMLEIFLKYEISPENPNPLCIQENTRNKCNITALKPGISFFHLFSSMVVSTCFDRLWDTSAVQDWECDQPGPKHEIGGMARPVSCGQCSHEHLTRPLREYGCNNEVKPASQSSQWSIICTSTDLSSYI